jgi:MoxR-like ATPase
MLTFLLTFLTLPRTNASFMATPDKALTQAIEQKSRLIDQLYAEIQKTVVGQQKMINRLLIGLLTNGHILLEGVPGLAKSLTVNSLAQALHLTFHRIQFTPDLLPADIIGTLMYNPRDARFEVKKGPVFANIILADEINRSPAKVQSALLEAMQEKQVTIGNETYPLERPFLVLATQNPIDQEGTYPLPEAQVDRFMMKIYVGYPTRDEELKIMRLMARADSKPKINPVIDARQIAELRSLIDQIQMEARLENYIVDLVMATRNPDQYKLPDLKRYIEFGASPRATISMALAAKAVALMDGRAFVMPQDIKEVAHDVLNHRIILTYEAEADGITTRKCIDDLLKTLPI